MAGIADTYTIDLVAQDADGTYLLAMVEDRPWGTHPDQSAQLQEKLNAYARYVLDGGLARQFPETVAGQVRIRLDCEGALTGHVAHVAEHAVRQLAAHGIDFHVNPQN